MILFPPIGLILYVGLCCLLGHLGRNTKFSFWGNFWVGVILTPVVGVVVLLAQENRLKLGAALRSQIAADAAPAAPRADRPQGS